MRKPRGYWTLENCQKEAAKYATRTEWRAGDSGSYGMAYRRGYLNQCMPAVRKSNGFWDVKLNCVESGLKYATRGDWQNSPDGGAYQSAFRRGWLADCCAHMTPGDQYWQDNDTIYIWRANGEHYNNLPVYKIGTTSARLGAARVKQCAAKSGKKPNIIVLAPVTGRATELEQLILQLGIDPGYRNIDGYTEFRALSDADLFFALELIQAHKPGV